jgi:hypothetical protein
MEHPGIKGTTQTKKEPKADFSTPSCDANSYGSPPSSGAPRTNISGPHDGGSSPQGKPIPGFRRKVKFGGSSNPKQGK